MNKDEIDLLSECIDYFPDTGKFFWKKSQGNVKVGTEINQYNSHYPKVNVNKKQIYLHRLAWILFYKEVPVGMIDHINGNRCDNRIKNLRLATPSLNNQNLQKAKANNKSGFLGVSYHKKSKKWRSTIRIGGKCKSLGYYESKEIAALVYMFALEKMIPSVN